MHGSACGHVDHPSDEATVGDFEGAHGYPQEKPRENPIPRTAVERFAILQKRHPRIGRGGQGNEVSVFNGD